MGGREHDIWKPPNERSRPDHAARQSRFADDFRRPEKPWIREDRRDGYDDGRSDRRGERGNYDSCRPVENRYREREGDYGRMGLPPSRDQRPDYRDMMHGVSQPHPGPVQAMQQNPAGSDRNGAASNGRRDLSASSMSGIRANGPPPNAPRGPKSQAQLKAPSNLIDKYRPSDARPRAGGSQRSASPRRANPAYQPANFGDRQLPFVRGKFGDPYLKADHEYDRVEKGRPPKDDTPDYDEERQWTKGYEVVNAFAEHFVGHEIAPEHIDAKLFEALREASPEALKRLARAINALSGHALGNLYYLNYSSYDHQGTTERTKWLVAGTVVSGPSIGICYNKKVIGIQSLDRAHSQWGTLCVKDKHGLLLEVVGKRAYVLWVTSFQGREDPKYNDERKFYFRLAHKDEETPPSKAQDVEVVRYMGGSFLDRGTFIHWTEPVWVELDVTPLARVGVLCKDQYAAVARIKGLPEQHQLRVRGKLDVAEPEGLGAVSEEEKSAEKAKLKEAQEKVELDGDDEDLLPQGDA